ncbi:MAG TPA: hypothetical protein VHS96_09485 [Bacteroidia bacterium]|nr:hypothetical protein [Bacteroidia bacterium]
MKKVLIAALFFACLSATGAFAQNSEVKGSTDQGSSQAGSTTRHGKNLGKGSPLLQRQGSGVSDQSEKASEAPAELEAAPAAPAAPSPSNAPTKINERKTAAPVNNGGEKPKE